MGGFAQDRVDEKYRKAPMQGIKKVIPYSKVTRLCGEGAFGENRYYSARNPQLGKQESLV